MVEYVDRQKQGNPNFMNEDYKKAVYEFAKMLNIEEISKRMYQIKNDSEAPKYIYVWTNGEVVYVGQTFNVAKRIYDELNDCRIWNNRTAWLHKNGYYQNYKKFAKDFKVFCYEVKTKDVTLKENEMINKWLTVHKAGAMQLLNNEAKDIEMGAL